MVTAIIFVPWPLLLGLPSLHTLGFLLYIPAHSTIFSGHEIPGPPILLSDFPVLFFVVTQTLETAEPLPVCVSLPEPRSDAVINRPQKPLLGEELKVTSVTSDTVGLSWTVPEGQFDSFVVQYKGKDGQPQVVSVEGHLREVSISSLDPARRYKLLLYGLYKGKRVGPLSAIVTTSE